MAEVITLVGIQQARGCLAAARDAEEKGEIAEAVALLEMQSLLMRKVKIADALAFRAPGRPQACQPLAGTG